MNGNALALTKRPDGDSNGGNGSVVMHSSYDKRGALIQSVDVKRTSHLTAPIMLLTGHNAPVLSCRFSPCGKYLASGSFDKNICMRCGRATDLSLITR